jgi:threonine dehydratase
MVLKIHPFDDPVIIEGQATVVHEIFRASICPIDYLFVSIGGGGLVSGIGSYFLQVSPVTKIIGVEPAGALSIAVLDYYADQIKGKNVVCIVSGSNYDITRTGEIYVITAA